MTVTTTTPRISYSGNGTTTVFALPYYFLSASDLRVLKRTALGVESVLSLGTQYTVTGAGVGAGGSVTLATAPASGESITIIRNPVIVQNTDYLTNDSFPAESHERALDLLTMVGQRLNDRIDRSLQLAESDTPGTGAYQGGNNRITGLAPGTQSSDAVTLLQVQSLITTSGGGGTGGTGGNGTPIVVPDTEVDRIVAITLADPGLADLFTPINTQYGNLASQVLALNSSVGSINTSVGVINVTVLDLQDQIDTLSAISGDAANVILLITNEETARIAGDDGIAQTIAKLGAAAGDNVSFLMNMDTVQISATETIGERFSGIATQFGTVEASVVSEASARSSADTAISQQLTKLGALNGGGTAFVFNLDTAYVGASESLGQRLSGIATTLNTNTAAITTEQSTRASADSSLAVSITNLQSTVGSHTTSISQQASTINGIQAKYTVKIDNNGYISGFGLISTANNGVPFSTFKILASAFEVYNGTTAVPAFSVTGGICYLENVVVRTGSLNANAVTESVLYTFSGSVAGSGFATNTTDWFDVNNGGSLNARLTVNNIPTTGGARVVVAVSMNLGAAGDGELVDYRMIRNDDVVMSPSAITKYIRETSGEVVSWDFIDSSPTSASHTYRLQMNKYESDGGVFKDVQLLAILYKK